MSLWVPVIKIHLHTIINEFHLGVNPPVHGFRKSQNPLETLVTRRRAPNRDKPDHEFT